MKTLEELNALKTEFEAVAGKLEGLTDEEMETVTGGRYPWIHQRTAGKGFAAPGEDTIIIKEKLNKLSDEELTLVTGGYVGDLTDETGVEG